MPVRLATLVVASLATATAGCASAPARIAKPVALPPPPNESSGRTADRLFQMAAGRAVEMAAKPYAPPADTLPAPFRNLDYDAYRKLRPMPEAALWNAAGEPFAILPLPRGHLYRDAVNLSIVDDAGVKPLSDTQQFYDFVDFAQTTPQERASLGASGWRVITRPGVAGKGYEVAVVQGASYFRVVGEGEFYGVSARALAIGAGSSEQEEFPRFTDFWIVRPERADDALFFVALIDSPSLVGAYRFKLLPGLDSTVDVQAELHPRRDIANPGVAPLSSMYLHGSADRGKFDDWRPEVHDSDGLSVVTGTGEQVFRPLSNPGSMRVTGFDGSSVKGFGLEQRRRAFESYDDLEAKYERRPSVWIEPGSDWGEGRVELVELPTQTEYDDNIAAFWRPAQPWRAGQTVRLSYRLHFTGEPAGRAPAARVVSTRTGASPYNHQLRRFVVDYAAADAFPTAGATAEVTASAGAVSNVTLIDGEAPGRLRLAFDLDPKGATAIDLRAVLHASPQQQTETWLFRWTPE